MSRYRSITILTFTLLSSLLVMPISYADWQYTKWGMDEAQVKAAANGRAVSVTPEERDEQSSESLEARLKAPYQSGDFIFTAYFQFDRASSKLAAVSLNMADPSKCLDLVGELTIKYGTPISESESAILSTWIWQPSNDQITVLQIGRDSAALIYQSRFTGNNEGL